MSRILASDLVSTNDRFPLDGTDNLYSGKLTWNATNSFSMVGTVFADPSSTAGASGVDPRQDPRLGRFESTAILNPDPSTWSAARNVGGTDYGLRATEILGFQGLVAVQFSHHQEQNLLTASDQIRTLDLTCPTASYSTPCGISGGFGITDGPADHNTSHRNQMRADATFYSGAHEIKLGGGLAYGASDSTYSASGGQEVFVLPADDQGPIYGHFYSARSYSDLTPVDGVSIRAKNREYGAYVQDSWRAAAGLTVNVGLRWDTEYLYNYQGVPAFSLGNEWQPRIGVVWDPWRDGITKVYAFAGRFAYDLPTIGTGWAFHDFTVLLALNRDPLSLVPDPALGYSCPFGCGGAANGGDPFDAVDHNLRGTYQDELSFGAERMIDPSLTVGVKATYRRLGNAIEDRCDFQLPGTTLTQCAIINPGSGQRYARGDAPVCDGYDESGSMECGQPGVATPPAQRTYRGIEIVARKTIGSTLWAQGSFLYSSLKGNYDGGVNETFQSTQPGLNQDFDWPQMWHNAYGRLFLDRPYHVRLDGFWVTPPGLSVGLQAFVESGAPVEQLGYFQYGPSVYLVPRGSAGRLPTQWEANLTLSYPFAVGPATATLQAYVFNLFNNQIATSRNNDWTTSPPDNYPSTIYDPSVPSNNTDLYGKYTARQPPRSFRAAVKVSF